MVNILVHAVVTLLRAMRDADDFAWVSIMNILIDISMTLIRLINIP